MEWICAFGGKPSEECCAKKDAEQKKCLKEKAKELAAAAGKAPASGGTTAGTGTTKQAGAGGDSKLEVGDIKVPRACRAGDGHGVPGRFHVLSVVAAEGRCVRACFLCALELWRVRGGCISDAQAVP